MLSSRNAEQRTDDDISDDPAGRRRLELAAASKARREAEARERRRANMAMQQRLKQVAARTDDELDTEAAAKARADMAAASRARLQAEQAKRRSHQSEMERRIRQVKASTDGEVDTNRAALMRAELTMRSRARKQAEDDARRSQNSALRRRIANISPHIDDELDTEAAALARAEFAARSKTRRAAEAAELKRRNAHMKERISAAQHHVDTNEQAAAIAELISARELDQYRESDVSTATFTMYQNWQRQQELGDEARRDRLERAERKRVLREELHTRGQSLAGQRAHQERLNRQIREDMAQANLEHSRAIRAEEATRQARAHRQRRRELGRIKERVAAARGLDHRLDAQEAANDAHERQEGSRMRAEMARQLKYAREDEIEARRMLTDDLRQRKNEGLSASLAHSMRDVIQRAQNKREQAVDWREQRAEREASYLQDARANKATAKASRENVKANTDAMHARKRQEAQKIRDEVDINLEAAIENVTAQKRHVASAYASRYVSSEEAREWENSPLKRLHAAARRAMEGLLDRLAFAPSPDATQPAGSRRTRSL